MVPDLATAGRAVTGDRLDRQFFSSSIDMGKISTKLGFSGDGENYGARKQLGHRGSAESDARRLLRRARPFDELEADRRPVWLRTAWAREGFPNDPRRVLDQPVVTGDVTPVVTARRLSPRAIELLVAHGTSWADATGYADIAAMGLDITRAAPKPLARNEVTAVGWSTTANLIAEYLLSRAQHMPTSSTGTRSVVDLASRR